MGESKFQISNPLLAQAIGLPSDARIFFAAECYDRDDTTVISVSHPDLKDGHPCEPQFRKTDTGAVEFVGWGQK